MRRVLLRTLAGLAVCAAALASWWAAGQAAPVATVALSSLPLASVGTAKQALALVLSIERASVGAQHRQAVYSPADEYIGYFDADSCYRYLNHSDPALRRFDRSGAATGRRCGGTGFSGNFMNWATASRLDLLRLGLTGGDRSVDTASLTLLQRAALPPDEGFYNGPDFPARSVDPATARDALPLALIGDWKGSVFIANCLDRVHFGIAATGSCSAPGDNARLGGTGAPASAAPRLSDDDFFHVRVRVCEADSTGRLLDPRKAYCAAFTAGNFKPVGALQAEDARLRVAVFGYLMDDRDARYGGVLRAPMPPNDAAGAAGMAPVEWDAATGVLIANPFNAAEGRSGAIHFINQIGRSGPTEGVYRRHAPLGELYYEALRYLQGLPPTPAAIDGTSDAMKAGFPAPADWADPHAGGSTGQNQRCVGNDILVIGNGSGHDDKSIPGNISRLDAQEFARAPRLAANEPDFVDWTRRAAALESARPVASTDSRHAPVPDLADMATADANAAGGGYHLAGMAYWAWTQDIRGNAWTAAPERQRPGMQARTHALDLLSTATRTDFETRRRTPLFLAAKYGGFDDRSGVGNPFVDAQGRPDDSGWESDAATGEPAHYRAATDARALLDGLSQLFAGIARPDPAVATTVAVTDASPRIDIGQRIDGYQTRYDPRRWSGDLQAVPLTLTADHRLTVGTAKEMRWSAAARLDAPGFDIGSRNIVVGRVDTSRATATPFLWDRLEDGAAYSLKALLDRPTADATAADGLGAARLAFLRGDRGSEGRLFRLRASRLGDFVHSGIVHSGAPSAGMASETYRGFRDAYAQRTPAVFAGANDGMLHAFDANTGAELFAYIPSWLGPQLGALTAPGYNQGTHRSFVDSTPAVAEAELLQSNGSARWASVLVGGTGAGGQGVYALDVSDPSAFDASKVLWEFTDRDDPDLGNVLRPPQVLKLRTNANALSRTAPIYRSYVVVASGVNSTAADGRAGSGTPALFLLDLSKPVGTAWKAGVNYHKISVPVDPALAAALAPGVLDFSVTTGAAGEVRFIYFGDLHGRLWKLDFLKIPSAQWDMEHLSAFKNASTPIPLFIAMDGSSGAAGGVQPISVAPVLAAGPEQSVIVAFGTGKYLEPSDNRTTDTAPQSVYALYDSARSIPDAADGSSAIRGRGRLAAGVSDTPQHIAVPAFAWGRPTRDGDTTQRAGWFFDLPAGGERQVGDMQISGSTLIFASLIPPDARQACGRGGGKLWRVQLATGEAQSIPSAVGVPGTPIVLQTGAAWHEIAGSSGRGASGSTVRVFVPGPSGMQSVDVAVQRNTLWGRLSWRRIHNYQELKNAGS